MSSRLGRYIKGAQFGGESYSTFYPPPLPPAPPLAMGELYGFLERAEVALGRLDGVSRLLPDPSLFLYMYIRKEAVLSSQIEGTQSSLSDLLLFESDEAPGVPLDDVAEVTNYVAAMNYGLSRLKELPLSLRLLKEIHGVLMNNARGGHKMPGEFRTSQNWIGGTRPGNALYVPPAPEHLMETLDAFEKFLHDESVKLPVLIKAALAHVQFETIHPFLDGNGRLGRLLITFILCSSGILQLPLLYLSLYLKVNRSEYYALLQQVREKGEWESWVRFFLEGVTETATQAIDTAKNIQTLFFADQEKIAAANFATKNLFAVYHFFQRQPLATSRKIKATCLVSGQTVLRQVRLLESLGIVREITGKGRYKVFAYQAYIDILNKGAEVKGRGL